MRKPQITISQEQFDELKQSSKQPYLTEARWHEWLQNDWLHLVKNVAWIKGVLFVLAAGGVAGLVKLFVG